MKGKETCRIYRKKSDSYFRAMNIAAPQCRVDLTAEGSPYTRSICVGGTNCRSEGPSVYPLHCLTHGISQQLSSRLLSGANASTRFRRSCIFRRSGVVGCSFEGVRGAVAEGKQWGDRSSRARKYDAKPKFISKKSRARSLNI